MSAADPAGARLAPADLDPDVPRLWRLSDLLADLLDEAELQHAALESGTPLGPVTGLPKLDRELAGRLVPGFHVVHGNTAAGKTSFALQVAATCGAPALFVTCEMAPVELLRRVIARAAGVYLGRLKSGELSRAAVAEHARDALTACGPLALLDGTRAYVTPERIREHAEAWRDAQAAAHVLVVVDSLHAWAGGAPAFADFGEYEALGAAVLDVQRMAAHLGAPVVVVTERNRSSADTGGVNAAAGSRKVEYGAETVLGLYRETTKGDDGKPRPKPFDATGEVGAHVLIEKNRHGAGGRVDLRFHGALQRFTEA